VAMVSLDAFRAAEIPPDLRARMETYVGPG
jgi:hypothetical protein